MKDIKKLYQPYYPQILKDNQGFKYNLSEESIFGNLLYSMNNDLLKGKSLDCTNLEKKILDSKFGQYRPVKLIPILRYKNS